MSLLIPEHPVIKPDLTLDEQITLLENAPEEYLKIKKEIDLRIKQSEEDPLNHGFQLEGWSHVDENLKVVDTAFVSGGNRSSKTEYGARTVVKAALENPGSEIVCFAQDNDASIRIQQRAVYRYLPPELKVKSKSAVEYLNYTVKNGFTGASFILPNGSVVYFHTYSQFISNRSKFEGLEVGSRTPVWLNIGLWLDEYLEDGDLVKTMRFRLATRNAKMLLTFTPIDGYTPFVADFLKGAETRKTKTADLLGGEEVPFVQYSIEKDAIIVYFHSSLNPFGGYERIAKELRHSHRDEVLTRAYGIPVKSMTTLFPLFNQNVHVLSDEEFPDISDKTRFTAYQVVDPAGARNYTSLWAGVSGKGSDTKIYIRREWPDRDTFGPWAEFGDPKWRFGPASSKCKSGVDDYIELFNSIEEELGIDVFERIGDSRGFKKQDHESVTLFDDFSDKGGLHFVPADGGDIERSIAKLDEWFHYNPNKPVDAVNCPRIYFHESCGNLIYSVINWGNTKKDEALKDFPDLLRYLRMANNGDGPEHYPAGSIGVIKRTTGGY